MLGVANEELLVAFGVQRAGSAASAATSTIRVSLVFATKKVKTKGLELLPFPEGAGGGGLEPTAACSTYKADPSKMRSSLEFAPAAAAAAVGGGRARAPTKPKAASAAARKAGGGKKAKKRAEGSGAVVLGALLRPVNAAKGYSLAWKLELEETTEMVREMKKKGGALTQARGVGMMGGGGRPAGIEDLYADLY